MNRLSAAAAADDGGCMAAVVDAVVVVAEVVWRASRGRDGARLSWLAGRNSREVQAAVESLVVSSSSNAWPEQTRHGQAEDEE